MIGVLLRFLKGLKTTGVELSLTISVVKDNLPLTSSKWKGKSQIVTLSSLEEPIPCIRHTKIKEVFICRLITLYEVIYGVGERICITSLRQTKRRSFIFYFIILYHRQESTLHKLSIRTSLLSFSTIFDPQYLFYDHKERVKLKFVYTNINKQLNTVITESRILVRIKT